MQPFLKPGKIITFQRTHLYEQGVFKEIIERVTLSNRYGVSSCHPVSGIS